MMASGVNGRRIQDGEITTPTGCPRGRADCEALARVSSPQFESYMCCGRTASAPVPTDILRFCMKSTHAHGVDMLVHLDERDAIDSAVVLMGGLQVVTLDRVNAAAAQPEGETKQ
jgi:hypothetical protein